MDLPVSNRSYAISRIVYIHLVIIICAIFISYTNFSLNGLKYLGALLIISSALSFSYYKKQNIKKASFQEGIIEVNYKFKQVKIPISEIVDISKPLNFYIHFNGKITLLYSIHLKNEYQFGNTLYLNFKNARDLNYEPEEISTIQNFKYR